MAVAATKLTGGASTTATTTCNFTAQASGVWLVLQVCADDYRTTVGGNRPESTGWTLRSSGQDEVGSYAWTLVSTGSEVTVNYTIGSAANSGWQIIAVTGADGTLDNTPTATHTHGGSSTSSTSVSPSAGNRYVLAALGAYHSSTNITGVTSWTNSYTQVGFQQGPTSGNREVVAAAGLATTTTAATSTAASWTGTSQLCSYGTSIVFREAGAAPTTQILLMPARSA